MTERGAAKPPVPAPWGHTLEAVLIPASDLTTRPPADSLPGRVSRTGEGSCGEQGNSLGPRGFYSLKPCPSANSIVLPTPPLEASTGPEASIHALADCQQVHMPRAKRRLVYVDRFVVQLESGNEALECFSFQEQTDRKEVGQRIGTKGAMRRRHFE